MATPWYPLQLSTLNMSIADMLLTTIKHSSVGSAYSLTSFTPGNSLCLWCRASSRQAVCSSSPSSSQGHLCFCKTSCFLQEGGFPKREEQKSKEVKFCFQLTPSPPCLQSGLSFYLHPPGFAEQILAVSASYVPQG